MDSLHLYEVNTYHHRQDLVQAANASRFLKQKRDTTRTKGSPTFMVWLLKRLFHDSFRESKPAQKIHHKEHKLTIG